MHIEGKQTSRKRLVSSTNSKNLPEGRKINSSRISNKGKSVAKKCFNRFPSVNAVLKKRNLLEIISIRGECPLFGSQALQLSAIEVFYSVIEKHPDFVDNTWDCSSEIHEVLTWCVKQLEGFVGEYSWLYFSDDFYKTIFVYLPHKFDESFHGVPMACLPVLQLKQPQLFDLLVDMLSLLNKICNIYLWDSEVEESVKEQLEYIVDSEEEYDKEDKELALKALEEYAQAISFSMLVNDNKTNLEEFKEKLSSIDSLDCWERSCIEWVKGSLVLIESHQSLTEYCFNPTPDTYPLLPPEYLKFIWNDSGRLFDNLIEDLDVRWQNEGSLPPTQYEDLSKIDNWKFSYSSWPQDLANFLLKGIELMNDFNNQTYE